MNLLSLVLAFLSSVSAHSYVTIPQSRSNQFQTQTGCRPPLCSGPCDAPKSKVGVITPVKPTKRGDKIDITWPRNNHAGGFIRISWAPTEESDDPKAFKQQFWTCHEMTCKASGADPLGGDSDGGAPGKCTTSVDVPSELKDGNWTMQWVWIGGAFALTDYYSCVDYSVAGGTPYQPDDLKPTFKGGDVYSNGNDTCLYFNTNDVGFCKVEPCTTGNRPGQHTGIPLYFETAGVNANQLTLPAPSDTQNPLSTKGQNVSSNNNNARAAAAPPAPVSQHSLLTLTMNDIQTLKNALNILDEITSAAGNETQQNNNYTQADY